MRTTDMPYTITSMTLYGEPLDNIVRKTPESAVRTWFRIGKKNPLFTSLRPATPAEGMTLIKWAAAHPDRIDEWAEKYHCPYKTSYLKDEIAKAAKKGGCSMQWDYDELHPFTMG